MRFSKLIAAPIFAAAFATQASGDALSDLAADYLALEANQVMMAKILAPETFAGQFASMLPPELVQDEAKLLAAGELLATKMAPLLPEIEAAMLEATIKHFTLEELQMLYDLYNSDLGVSIAEKMGVYMVDAMADINPKIMEVSMAAAPELLAILQSE